MVSSSASIVVYRDGKLSMGEAPSWWEQDEWFSNAPTVTSLEVGPIKAGLVGRSAPEGYTVCLTGNDPQMDVRMLWCPTEADYIEFLCGPGGNFVSVCAQILGADPLKRGSWS